jgi:hypothetical protein
MPIDINASLLDNFKGVLKRVWREKEKERKYSAGSDDTSSMIKGGGYLGARTRQPSPRKQLERNLCGAGGLCAVAPGPNPWLLLLVLQV